MDELLRISLLLGFVGLLVAVRAASGETRRRRVEWLALYTVAASLGVGLTQWSAWPFAEYTLAAARPSVDKPICLTHFYGATEAGREWRVDTYAWSPVFDSTLQTWFETVWPTLPPAAQDRTLGFLASRAEAARARLQHGREIGFARILGAGHLPYWWLLPRHRDVPAEPLAALRAYRACRVPRAWLESEEPWHLQLVAEWHR